MPHNKMSSHHLVRTLLLPFALSVCAAQPAIGDEATQKPITPRTVDFIDAEYLEGHDAIAVTGHRGLVGLLRVQGDGSLKLEALSDTPDEDFTALGRLSPTEALIGSSSGRVYLYDGKSLEEIQQVSEYEEPVLDIIAVDGKAWLVGGRGLVAKSNDGRSWEAVEIRDVEQPTITWPNGKEADWYFGVANVDADTVEFTGNVGGDPAVPDEHYELFYDEGFAQFSMDLDDQPPPTIKFTFQPGPPFRPSDVTWNVVLLNGDTVTLAGEFGMILQSTDDGETWVRRDAMVVPKEPEPPYWLAGYQDGDRVWLAGAGGVNSSSDDGGATWTRQPSPGREGIFGIRFLDTGDPIIAGAVGLIGTLSDGEWSLADRTRLRLLSWLKTPIPMQDGSIVMLGGRSTAIRYSGGDWSRVRIESDL
jgi:photosystem II stability/assembly factor-like uncharacterized protein